MEKKKNLCDLLIYVLSAELVGAVSALLAGDFSSFFETRTEPPLLPPAWVFPVVWTVLYALMGAGAYLADSFAENERKKRRALNVYRVQLALNFVWSILFFRFGLLWAAAADVVLLFIAVFVMIALFAGIKSLAGWINIPYLLWVGFAGYLNIATAVINPA